MDLWVNKIQVDGAYMIYKHINARELFETI